MTKKSNNPAVEFPLCETGAEPDRFKIFATLREMWKKQEEGRTYAGLSDHLGYTKQQVSQWATGSGGKSPAPWSVLMTMCNELGFGIAIEPSGVKIYRMTT